MYNTTAGLKAVQGPGKGALVLRNLTHVPTLKIESRQVKPMSLTCLDYRHCSDINKGWPDEAKSTSLLLSVHARMPLWLPTHWFASLFDFLSTRALRPSAYFATTVCPWQQPALPSISTVCMSAFVPVLSRVWDCSGASQLRIVPQDTANLLITPPCKAPSVLYTSICPSTFLYYLWSLFQKD